MKILLVTESVPFPPLNGRELPIAGLFEQLCKRHEVDLLVLQDARKNPTGKVPAIPAAIRMLGIVNIRPWSLSQRLQYAIRTGRHALSAYHFPVQDIRKLTGNTVYDFAWISPVLMYGLATACRDQHIHLFHKLAFGINDVKTTLYRDGMNEILHTRIFNRTLFTQWMLSFLMKREEQHYFKLADLVHVQTAAEAAKAKNILPGTRIIVAPNGIKTNLFGCTANGIGSGNRILYMTHLDGGRSGESVWFITKVWPRIAERLPGAMLLIVGRPPKQIPAFIENNRNIIINGFADDLVQLFNSVRLVVVPTFHGTGLINRIADALAAGLPVVSTPQAIATFPGLKHGVHVLSAKKAEAFADAVVRLYNDEALRRTLSQQGRIYAQQFPDWVQSAQLVEQAMLELVQ